MTRCKNQYTRHSIYSHLSKTKTGQNSLYCGGHFCTTWNHSSSSTTFLTLWDDMITTFIFTLYSNCCTRFARTNHLFLHNNCVTGCRNRCPCHNTYSMTCFNRFIPHYAGPYNTINNVFCTAFFITNSIPIHSRFWKCRHIGGRHNIFGQHIALCILHINSFHFVDFCL